MKEYFLIYFGEDGISIKSSSKKDIEELINSLGENPNDETDHFVKDTGSKFYMDGGNYPLYKYLIIKGEVIIPKPVEIVKKYII